jgi:hypothetical protein
MIIKRADINAAYDPKPIPLRSCDWVATLDGYDGGSDGPSDPIGYGATEAAAIADLIEAIELRYDEDVTLV